MGQDPEMFFPERGDTTSGFKAQMLCFTCPVRQQCKDWRIASGSTDGIWAGEYHSEKREIKRRKEG